MKRKWSEEAVLRNRRKRMARRLYRKEPLFAIQKIQERFGIEYTHKDFFEDLPLKGGKQPKRRLGKVKSSGKKDYLRSLKTRILFAIKSDDQKEIRSIITRYYQIQSNISKPWEVLVKIKEGAPYLSYYFPVKFSQARIKLFMKKVNQALAKGALEKDIDDIYDQFIGPI